MALGEQNVFWFDVAMNDSGGVGTVECLRNLSSQAHCLIEAEPRLPAQPFAKRFTLDIGHRVPQYAAGLTAVVNGQDVRMLERRREADLAFESLNAHRGSELRCEA